MSISEPLEAPSLIPATNYTIEDKKQVWWCVRRWGQDHQSIRRCGPFSANHETCNHGSMIICSRINFQNNNEVGAFCRLTNCYAIVGDEYGSERFSK